VPADSVPETVWDGLTGAVVWTAAGCASVVPVVAACSSSARRAARLVLGSRNVIRKKIVKTIANGLNRKSGFRSPGDPDFPLLPQARRHICAPSGKRREILFASGISFSAPPLFF
jgi:hypothetical protein